MLEGMAHTTPPTDEGTVLADRYRLDKIVGRGGMSTVYRARDLSLERDVAIKVFTDGAADDATTSRRQDEMLLLARLDHPGLVTLFDCITGPRESTVLVMQYIDGDDLRKVLVNGPLPATTVADLGAGLADALSYLAAEGVVHRDVKPANVLLPTRSGDSRPRAKLADFGIARLVDATSVTAAGTVIGTMSYLSPEQALGRPVGPATDVYSLGLVLIESLSGERCFPGTGAESIAARVSGDPEIPASLGTRWVDLLQRMTAREPEQRITAEEAAQSLRSLAAADPAPDPTLLFPVADEQETERFGVVGAGEATTQVQPIAPALSQHPRPEAAPRSGEPRNRRPGRPARTVVLVAAIVAVIIAGGVGAVAWSNQQAQQHATEIPSVPYPAVDGDLGVHLQELQESVAP